MCDQCRDEEWDDCECDHCMSRDDERDDCVCDQRL
jgi:hypothetical protein